MRSAGAFLLLLACGRPGPEPVPSQAAWLLDGMFLAPPLESGGALLLCQRFEVTREEFAGVWSRSSSDLPATFVSREEARDWARDRGLRLPSGVEWRHLAVAGAGQPPPRYPWGPRYIAARANTVELGRHQALPVGVFERGTSALGGYDFSGNVWEWVDDPPDPEWSESEVALTGAAMGGSYASSVDDATVQSVRVVNPDDRAEDLGFRAVAAAAPWILAQVDPLWRAGQGRDRSWIERAFLRWRPDLRRRLAEELETAGASAEMLAALRAPKP
ncbi:MAG TPA: SUMF1/EgtB/PvdO family nonheme iron enzyme [Planctomycetota bacterium]